MKFLTITGGQHDQLSPHFNESEFYSNSSDRPASHPFAEVLVQAAEIIRTHFNCRWRITSTFRTRAHEARILKEANVPFFISQHMLGRAEDGQPAEDTATNARIMREIWLDFTTEGELYQKLRAIGITGFGIYNTFIHLDCREDQFKAHRRDKFGLVARWDSRTGKARTVGNSWGAAWVSQPGTTTNPQPTSPAPASPTTSSQWLTRRRPSVDSCSR